MAPAALHRATRLRNNAAADGPVKKGDAVAVTDPWRLPFDPQATHDDVLACFRLILGRWPHPAEWTGHAALAGRALPEVVAGYLNSAEFAARDLLQRRAPADVRLVSLPDYKIYAPLADEAVGRHAAAGVYEPHVEAVLRRALRPGMAMLDVGANIGVFALLAAALVGPAGAVWAVEPNAANTRLLEASRLANGFAHLRVCQVAAAPSLGLLALNAFNSNGSTSPADERTLLGAETVAAVPLDMLVPAANVAVVKIDVEGAELGALQGASGLLRRCRPLLVSEFSPGMLRGTDGPGYLRFLGELGYRLAVIERSGAVTPDLDADAVMAAWHASGVDHIDILATPAS